MQQEKQNKSGKSGFTTLLSTAIYAGTILMILAFLYQSFVSLI